MRFEMHCSPKFAIRLVVDADESVGYSRLSLVGGTHVGGEIADSCINTRHGVLLYAGGREGVGAVAWIGAWVRRTRPDLARQPDVLDERDAGG